MLQRARGQLRVAHAPVASHACSPAHRPAQPLWRRNSDKEAEAQEAGKHAEKGGTESDSGKGAPLRLDAMFVTKGQGNYIAALTANKLD